MIIAHRGASAEAPESTASAIRRAVVRRADMIELDVQVTRDRRLVVFHDERLERTTNGVGRLVEWRYRELARLDAGAWFAARFAKERVLLVSQALRLVPPPHLVNLEIKPTTSPRILIRGLRRCLQWTRTASQVLVSSFDPSLLALLRGAAPRLALALVCRGSARAAIPQAMQLRCRAIHPHASMISALWIRRAHAAGLRVHVWTIDSLREARRVLRMGADGLMTNDPRRLQAIRHLRRRHPWEAQP